MSPEAANQHVSSVFASVIVKVADNRVGLRFKVILLLCWATCWVDFGFLANHRWEEGLGLQVTQFILYLIVTRDHEVEIHNSACALYYLLVFKRM
jgi:hypothetical protein